jgi:hypothetical protein
MIARYIAEQIRIGKAGSILAMGEPASRQPAASVSFSPTHSALFPIRLSLYTTPRKWVDAIVTAVTVPVRTDGSSAPSFDVIKRYLISDFFTYHSAWHARNAQRKRVPHLTIRTIVLCLYTATVTIALIHILQALRPSTFAGMAPLEGRATHARWLTVAALALPALGAALHAIDRQMEYERSAQRSKRIAKLLDRYLSHAQKARDFPQLRRATVRAARAIQVENYDWWTLLVSAPPELGG